MVLVKNLKFCERFVLCKLEGKIGIFAKGIVHDFGQKVEVFSSFVFIKNRSRKSVC